MLNINELLNLDDLSPLAVIVENNMGYSQTYFLIYSNIPANTNLFQSIEKTTKEFGNRCSMVTADSFIEKIKQNGFEVILFEKLDCDFVKENKIKFDKIFKYNLSCGNY